MPEQHQPRDNSLQTLETMRIAFDAKRYYHNRTGLGNYSRTLVNSLRTCFPENEYVLFDEKSFARSFKMARKAEGEGCGILHGLSNEIPFDSPKSGIKTIVTIHDVAWRTYPGMYHFIDRQIYDLKYGWSAKHADMVLAISESTKRDVQRFYGVPEERVKVVYQPVQERFYTQLPKEESRQIATAAIPNLPHEYLLSVGSINSRKNLLGSLQALAQTAPENRPPLVVIGNGREYKKICQEYASKNLRASDVIWAGQLNDDHALQALYANALAMMYPSHYEGFGLPVVEALLQGTPVLTSTVSSLPEAAGPGGILVDPSNTEDIANGLKSLINDSELRRQKATEGEAYCRQTFGTEKLTRQVMELYKQL